MGHARSYVTFDIIRRILSDYFGYNILFVMNITDIDDKIITRARHVHLFQQYSITHKIISNQLLDDCNNALKLFLKVNFNINNVTDIPPKPENGDSTEMAKYDMKMEIIKKTNSISSAELNTSSKDLLSDFQHVLSPWLDAQLGNKVTDPKVFRELSAHWENEFLKDMTALNVLPADVLTRVSEYVPEIVTTIENIIANGFGYQSSGSVYFDTVNFEAHGHCYAKLEPWSKGNQKLIEEGEGSLSTNNPKKSVADFALWKASKPGEPAWDSPWGKGRPGWHIECSAMAGDVLGEVLDIHSGGIDLAFPHHDNELAQAEVNLFLERPLLWIHCLIVTLTSRIVLAEILCEKGD
jgi:cysteinyl-tRNA synthetase